MSSSIGENIRLTIFGQSHSPAIGMTLEGIPAGNRLDLEELDRFLARRAPGRNAWSTQRKESDRPEFLSGLVRDTTCGVPLTAIIRNGDARSGDYALLKEIPRPGHADFAAEIKYRGFQDVAGGGHFSGRLTAPLCVAGGICLQLLAAEGIRVFARIASVGGIDDEGPFLAPVAEKDFPVVSDAKGAAMRTLIAEKKAAGDSVGGIVECVATGLPAGLGDPIFGGMENRISALVFGIPAVKGIEFGAGFAVARMSGSENNDPYRMEEGKVVLGTNHCGGILGGITVGSPLVFRAAFKPTPSIARPQQSVRLSSGEDAELIVPGRHDPCVVPRAVPCVEAAAAIAIYDALLGRRKEGPPSC